MNIFKKRENLLPYEYPHLLKFKDAIRHSYWLHTEVNLTSDLQDFKVNISDVEKVIITRTMLAISQIEVSVKLFWGDLYKRMPKPEIAALGFTHAEDEIRHQDSYSFLLQTLGLQDEFTHIHEVPAIRDRMKYLNKYMGKKDNKEFIKSVLLFSVFVENVSLFSQFLIMMSFNRYKNQFKGISNLVEWTSKDEAIHAETGLAIIDIVRNENPDWFNDELNEELIQLCNKAFKSELKILDWIFEKGELDFLPKDVIIEFIKNRFNSSMVSAGIGTIFDTNKDLLEKSKWFEVELTSTKEGDFFDKRQIDYTKFTESITEDDIF